MFLSRWNVLNKMYEVRYSKKNSGLILVVEQAEVPSRDSHDFTFTYFKY